MRRLYKIILIVAALLLGVCSFTIDADSKILLFEDFESSQESQPIAGFNGWEAVYHQTDGYTLDCEYTTITEPYTENKVACLYRPTSTSQSLYYMLKKDLSQTVSDGIVSIRFKVLRKNTRTKTFWLHLGDSKGKLWEIYGSFTQSTIEPQEGESAYFGDGVKDESQSGYWYDFEILLNFDSGEYLIKENDRVISKWKPVPKAYNSGNLASFYFGTTRGGAGNSAEVYFDDICIKKVDALKFGEANFFLKNENYEDVTDSGLKDGTITCRVETKNDFNSEHTMMAIIAHYRDGKIENINTKQWTVESLENKNQEIELLVSGTSKGKNKIKCFVLSDIKNLIPLTEEFCLEQYAKEKNKTYYVSPNGNDSYDGTKEKPFKTLRYAASILKAGETVILEDGTYEEMQPTFFKNSGRKYAPITVKAQNAGRAVIVYDEALKLVPKFNILQHQNHITVDGLSFKQNGETVETDPLPTADIFLICKGNNCNIINNNFSGAFEEGIKLYLAKNGVVENNFVENMKHEGIDLVNCVGVAIKNNEIKETGRVGIMVKGGSRDIQVYNNFVHNAKVTQATAAITVGGATDGTSAYDTRENISFEIYNSYFYNNIIYSPTGRILSGFMAVGAKDCMIYNNTVVGAKLSAVRFTDVGENTTWKWSPINTNIKLYNNIYADCGDSYRKDSEPVNIESDYNLFYGNKTTPTEINSIYKVPAFSNEANSDFRLEAASSALGAGKTIPLSFIGFYGNAVDLYNKDYNNNLRTAPWNIGACGVKR